MVSFLKQAVQLSISPLIKKDYVSYQNTLVDKEMDIPGL